MNAKNEITLAKLFEMSGNFWQACTIQAAVQMDVFTIIGQDWASGDQIANKLKSNPRSVKMFLNALSAVGLLIKQEDKYANTDISKIYLIKSSPKYSGHIILHQQNLVNSWSRLSEAVKSGGPVERDSTDKEYERENFLMGMFNLAINIAPGITSQIDLSNRKHLLDLGGGPGTYAIYFCLGNPNLKATVYDLPTTKPYATRTIEQFDMSSRIDFVGSNYIEEELTGTYDVAWLSHVLHSEGPENCQKFIQKVVSRLEDGGLILIHDFILDDTLDAPPFPTLFSLNMLINTPGGQSYSEGQIKEMLAKAGVKEIRRLPFKGPNDSGIIQGTI